MDDFVEWILFLAEIYLSIGVLFVVFILGPTSRWWKDRLGNQFRDSSWGFRILIVPSLVGLWPLLIWSLRETSHAKAHIPSFLSWVQVAVWLALLLIVPAGIYVAVQNRAVELSPQEEVSELDHDVKQGGQ